MIEPKLLSPEDLALIVAARERGETLSPEECDRLLAHSAAQEIEIKELRDRLREYHSDVDGDDIKYDPKYDGVHGIVQWVKDSKRELEETKAGIFDTGLRCVSEGGEVFYFDPEELEMRLAWAARWKEAAKYERGIRKGHLDELVSAVGSINEWIHFTYDRAWVYPNAASLLPRLKQLVAEREQKARDEGLEEAARECDTHGHIAQGWATTHECARRIRAMMKTKPL